MQVCNVPSLVVIRTVFPYKPEINGVQSTNHQHLQDKTSDSFFFEMRGTIPSAKAGGFHGIQELINKGSTVAFAGRGSILAFGAVRPSGVSGL
jgi:hypothetical protein